MDLSRYRFFKKHGYMQMPTTLQIEITIRCPLNCPQCYKIPAADEDMEYGLFIRIVEEAVQIGVKSITLNGGEPLLHPHFVDMVNLVIDSGIDCGTIISGWGLTESILQALPKDRLHLFLSLNGSTEAVNSLSRDGYHHAIRAAELCKKHNRKYCINWVARHDNLNDLPNLIDFAEAYGADRINIVLNKLTGSGDIVSPLSEADYAQLKQIVNAAPDKILVQNCFDQAFRLLNFPSNPLYGCSAGIYNCAIDRNGRFMPCTHLMYPERYPSIRDYWENSDTLKILRSRAFVEDCGACPLTSACHFCRAQSRRTHDNLTKGLEKCILYGMGEGL